MNNFQNNLSFLFLLSFYVARRRQKSMDYEDNLAPNTHLLASRELKALVRQ